MDSVDAALTVTVGNDPDGTPVVSLHGELDLATSATAEQAFATLPVPENGSSTVVVDAANLTFMDSSGLTVLLMTANRGYTLRIREPQPIIRNLISATGLAETLRVEA